MDDPSPRSQGTRIALLCWLVLVSSLLLFRPGQWNIEGAYAHSILAAWIGSISVIFLFECRAQALGWALAAMIPLLWRTLPVVSGPLEAAWLLDETLLMAALGVLVLLWSEIERRGFDIQFWMLLLLAASALEASIWLEAHQTPTLEEAPFGPGAVALQRLRQWTLGFLALGGLAGFVSSFRMHGDIRNRAAALAVTLLAPGLGFALARARTALSGETMFQGADWLNLPGELFTRPLALSDGSWAWFSPTVILVVMLVGVYRLWSRGRKMGSRGEMPLTWLLAIFTLGTLAVMIPGPHPGFTPLPLVVLGVWLPVFIVADLCISGAERLTREPPAPGPSDVPRVR